MQWEVKPITPHGTVLYVAGRAWSRKIYCRPSSFACNWFITGCARRAIANLWHACPKWHAEKFPWYATFTAVPIFRFLCPTTVAILCTICVYIYRYLTPYRLYINCCCYTNLNGAKCSLDIYCCDTGLAVTGPIRDIGQNVLLSAFEREAAAAARLLPFGLAYRISGEDRYWHNDVTVC